jgi:hypothetical protein
MNHLIKTLNKAGKATEVLNAPGVGRILVLPHGGRILGLFPEDSHENFLWTNPALDRADTAKAFFASREWCNTGGDRTWLAPENDFFRPEYPSASVYFQPRQLDPGRYACQRTANCIRMESTLRLHSYRTREVLTLRITKEVEPVANPFRQATDESGLTAVPFAGYTLRTTLNLKSSPKRTAAGLWNLLQMPHGGCMFVPTRFPAQPTKYFGRFPRQDLVAGGNAIRYAMRRPGEHKIGIAAIALTGRAGYLYRSGSTWSLVVRSFAVNPSGSYVDALPNAGRCPGDAFQACSVSSEALGNFSELEYHAPAIGAGTGLNRCEDVSQVWAFRGDRTSIECVAKRILGVSLT